MRGDEENLGVHLHSAVLGLTLGPVVPESKSEKPVDGHNRAAEEIGMNASLLMGVLLFAAMMVQGVNAQEFPTRPVRFMIPLAAGGGGDITVRAVSQKLNAAWGQAVVVDNRPAAPARLHWRQLPAPSPTVTPS